jgi:DNA repair protein RecO (recombination protein O)
MLIACLEKNDPHPEIFAIVLGFLQSLKTTGEKVIILKNYTVFETKLMSFLGFGYNFEKCNITGVGLPEFISPKTGNAVNYEVAKGFEDQLFPIPKFILNENIEAKISDIKKMLDINLHFLKLHIDLQSLPVREFTINLF